MNKWVKRGLWSIAVIAVLYAGLILLVIYVEPNESLYNISGNGYKSYARIALWMGADVNTFQGLGMTPLMAAASNGHTDVVELLLDKGADPDETSTSTMRCIDAILPEDHLMKPLYEMNLDDDGFMDGLGDRPYRRTALMLACMGQHWETAELLIDRGAKINLYSNGVGFTTLHWALTREGNPEFVRKLLNAGAYIEARDDLDRTPLHVAVEFWSPLEVVQILVGAGADIHARDAMGDTPLMVVGRLDREHASEIARYLIENGANIHDRNRICETPLLKACFSQGNVPLVKFFISEGADVADVNTNFWTPLIYSVWSQDAEIAKVLLANGATPFETDRWGESVLDWARKKENKEMVALLEAAMVEKEN